MRIRVLVPVMANRAFTMVFKASANSGVPVLTIGAFLVWCTFTFAISMVKIITSVASISWVFHTFAFTSFRVVDGKLRKTSAVFYRASASAVFTVPVVVSIAEINIDGPVCIKGWRADAIAKIFVPVIAISALVWLAKATAFCWIF